MMHKQGFLLGEFTLKTVLAVLGILLLIYLLTVLYATFSQQRALEQAQGSLERIQEGIGQAAMGEKFMYVLTEPKSWKLIFYPSGLSSVAACNGGVQCLCLCKKAGFFSFSSQQSNCGSSGACTKIGVALTMPSDITVDGPTSITISKNTDGKIQLVHP